MDVHSILWSRFSTQPVAHAVTVGGCLEGRLHWLPVVAISLLDG